MNYKVGFYVLLVLILIMAVSACSARTQVRFEGTMVLGDLPDDVLYKDGIPVQVNLSTESDGDVVLSYLSDHDQLIGQLYGCAYISLNCDRLYKQGRYALNIPANRVSK